MNHRDSICWKVGSDGHIVIMRSLKECICTEKSASVELYSFVTASLAASRSLHLLQFSTVITFRTMCSRNWSWHYGSIGGVLRASKVAVRSKSLELPSSKLSAVTRC